MLGRAARHTRECTHAYLVLLRVEVAAFHPDTLISEPIMRHGVTVAECYHPRARLVSVVLFLNARMHRTVVNRYPALRSPDLPRHRLVPRLPSLPRDCIVV